MAGTLASSATVVDVGALAQHSNALLSTSAHMMQVKAVASGFSRSKKINEWVDAILQAKSAKAAIRGTGLAAGAIPVPAIGVLAGVVAAAAKCNVKLTLSALIKGLQLKYTGVHFKKLKLQVHLVVYPALRDLHQRFFMKFSHVVASRVYLVSTMSLS